MGRYVEAGFSMENKAKRCFMRPSADYCPVRVMQDWLARGSSRPTGLLFTHVSRGTSRRAAQPGSPVKA